MLKRTCTLSAAVVVLTAISFFTTGTALANSQDSTTTKSDSVKAATATMVMVMTTRSDYDSTEFKSESNERSGFWSLLTWNHDRKYWQKAKGPRGILDPYGPAPYGRLVYDIHGYPYRTYQGGYRSIPCAIPSAPVIPNVYQGVPPELLATIGVVTRQQPDFPNVVIRDYGEYRDGPEVNAFSIRVQGCSAALGTGTVVCLPIRRWFSVDGGGGRFYLDNYGPGKELPGRPGIMVDGLVDIWGMDTPACQIPQATARIWDRR